MNAVLNSTILNNPSLITSTASMTETPTTAIVYNNHLFLQTAACQSIAGAFTWAAILITGYHVK
jgi:hypothetical protein